MIDRPTGPLGFTMPFRAHQELILSAFERERASSGGGVMRFHAVAPPGAGKTIVGLEIARRLGRPALVICPNTAIQGQWVKKLGLFLPEGADPEPWISGSPDAQKFLNVLTYQVLSIPEDPGEAVVGIAQGLWVEDLCAAGSCDEAEARQRIAQMKDSNPAAWRREMARYTKRLRTGRLEDEAGTSTDFVGLLHPNTRALLQRLRNAGVKTVIFDECHHLQSWWAQIMKHILDWMEIDAVVGLTATPPVDAAPDVLQGYMSLLGDIDFQIPTPAVVKDGMLAPYQDLVRFCIPDEQEMGFLRNCHQKLHALLAGFCEPSDPFRSWIVWRFLERRLADGSQREWAKLAKARPDYAAAGVKFLRSAQIPVPVEMMMNVSDAALSLDDWIMLVEDYALNKLKISSDVAEGALFERIRDAFYGIGFILTEKGVRSYRSPLDRVLAYSRSKLSAVRDILAAEFEAMGPALRAAVVTDFETSDALSLKKTDAVLDAETGGAVAVMRLMTKDPVLDRLNPVLVTGRSLLCDDDLCETFLADFRKWAKDGGLDLQVEGVPASDGAFFAIEGSGRDWNTRSAILFATTQLDAGRTQCLIGTRGLLGEGWDSLSLNTVVDLSTASTHASVNQLRGRSIRKDDRSPRKLANNWDVVSVAPGLEKGRNDWERMRRKHERFYGLTQDGQIQKGLNHLDASLAFDKELDAGRINEINESMLRRARNREAAYSAWRVGEPFRNLEQACFEMSLDDNLIPRDTGNPTPESAQLRRKATGAGVQGGLGAVGLIAAAVAGFLSLPVALGIGAASALFLYGGARTLGAAERFSRSDVLSTDAEGFARRVSLCVLESLRTAGLVPSDAGDVRLQVSRREDNSLRIFLDAAPEASALFAASLDQVLSPVVDQRYAIPRYEGEIPGVGLFAGIRAGLSPGKTVVADWHPLPDALGQNKERALAFEGAWNRHVSRGQAVFLRSEEGERVLREYGMSSKLGIRRHTAMLWR